MDIFWNIFRSDQDGRWIKEDYLQEHVETGQGGMVSS